MEKELLRTDLEFRGGVLEGYIRWREAYKRGVRDATWTVEKPQMIRYLTSSSMNRFH